MSTQNRTSLFGYVPTDWGSRLSSAITTAGDVQNRFQQMKDQGLVAPEQITDVDTRLIGLGGHRTDQLRAGLDQLSADQLSGKIAGEQIDRAQMLASREQLALSQQRGADRGVAATAGQQVAGGSTAMGAQQWSALEQQRQLNAAGLQAAHAAADRAEADRQISLANQNAQMRVADIQGDVDIALNRAAEQRQMVNSLVGAGDNVLGYGVSQGWFSPNSAQLQEQGTMAGQTAQQSSQNTDKSAQNQEEAWRLYGYIPSTTR